VNVEKIRSEIEPFLRFDSDPGEVDRLITTMAEDTARREVMTWIKAQFAVTKETADHAAHMVARMAVKGKLSTTPLPRPGATIADVNNELARERELRQEAERRLRELEAARAKGGRGDK
jgi:hypothetical protein